MKSSRSDGFDFSRENLHRFGPGGSGTIPQFAVKITSHCPKATVVFYEQAMMSTSGYRLDSSRKDLNGLIASGSGTIAELSIRIISHGPKATVLFEDQAMVITRSDRLYFTR